MTFILETRDLTVSYGGQEALSRVSLRIRAGSCLGIIGESGCGKTTLAHALLGVLPRAAKTAGNFIWAGREVEIGSPQHSALRGTGIGLVSQDASASLNPSITIAEHFAHALRDVAGIHRKDRDDIAVQWLRQVHIGDLTRMLRAYPHQLSGGQQQRILIALALCTNPGLIVLDECTSSLDTTVQAQIMRLLNGLRERLGLSMLAISHDLDVVASLADEIAVLYAGQVVEQGPAARLAELPFHPYTKGLASSTPRSHIKRTRLPFIGGQPTARPAADICRFQSRCPFVQPQCLTVQELQPVPDGYARCIRVSALAGLAWPAPSVSVAERAAAPEAQPLLEAHGLSKSFRDATDHLVQAVDNVDLMIRPRETLGLVGESGAGKTTLVRCLVGVVRPDRGQVIADGRPVCDSSGKHRFPHQQIQILYQDSRSALNPRQRVIEQVARPLVLYQHVSRRDSLRAAASALDQVGLPPSLGDRYPRELSGGEAQRAAIARVLICRPGVVILDEPVSALDVSTQAALLNLLADLRDELNIAYLLIGHDLAVIEHLADRVAVMHKGRIVETGAAGELFSSPSHPYTRELIAAVPGRVGQR